MIVFVFRMGSVYAWVARTCAGLSPRWNSVACCSNVQNFAQNACVEVITCLMAGSTMILLGIALGELGFIRRRIKGAPATTLAQAALAPKTIWR